MRASLFLISAPGTLGTREYSVIPDPCTLGTREDSVISESGTLRILEDSVTLVSGTLRTREDSAISARGTFLFDLWLGTRGHIREGRQTTVLGLFSSWVPLALCKYSVL